MEKDKKKEEALDEQFLISMMAGGVQKNGLSQGNLRQTVTGGKPEQARGKQKPKAQPQGDYEALFFRNAGGNARDGKSVYIRPEFHVRLSRIVQVIGEDKISLYTYLDNVLEYHFEEFAAQIVKSFNDKYKPIL